MRSLRRTADDVLRVTCAPQTSLGGQTGFEASTRRQISAAAQRDDRRSTGVSSHGRPLIGCGRGWPPVSIEVVVGALVTGAGNPHMTTWHGHRLLCSRRGSHEAVLRISSVVRISGVGVGVGKPGASALDIKSERLHAERTGRLLLLLGGNAARGKEQLFQPRSRPPGAVAPAPCGPSCRPPPFRHG